MIMTRWLYSLFVTWLLIVPARADTIVASSCSQADVQTAVTASSDGDTVEIPNGSCAWASGISTTKQIRIEAQNYTPTSGGDTARNVVLTNNSSGPMFHFTTGNSYHVGIAGIRINEGTGGTNALEITGSGSKVALVNDMYFEGDDRFGSTESVSVIAWKALGGVVWNTRFVGVGDPITISGAFFLVHSPRAWTTASTMGSLDTNGDVNLYIEDSSFYNIHPVVDADQGARVVFRYSTFDGSAGLTHGFTSPSGGRHLEYYNNTFSVTDEDRTVANRYVWLRAGTAVFTDNVVNDASCTSCFGSIHLFEIGDNTSPGTYPMPRQPGYGHNGSTDVSDPIYSWNNTGARAYTWGYQDFPGGWEDIVVANRDVFVNAGAKPGYQKYAYPHPARSTVESTTADYTITFAGQSTDVCTISFTTEAVSVDGTFALADGDITAFACTITATSPNLELDENDLQYPVGLDYTVSGGKVVALDLQTKTSNELQIGSAIAGRVGNLWQIFGEGTALAGSSNTITIGDVQ